MSRSRLHGLIAGLTIALTLPAAGAAQGKAPSDTVTISTQGSNLSFEPDRITLKAGTLVLIRYINEGTFPHNIVIPKTENDIDPLGGAAFQAGSTGYIPMNMKERMIAYSPLAEPGKTIEFSFIVPPPGEYNFVCLYPGHYNMMLGTLRVTE